MAGFTIEVQDSGVAAALNKLAERVRNPRPVLRLIAEGIMERTKERFATSTGPDGQRWKANARSTIESYIEAGRGFGKRGINAKGRKLAMNKKPLIGHSGDLKRQFHIAVTDSGVTIKNTMIYAAMQQFGGQTRPSVIVPRTKQALAFGGVVVKKVNHPGVTIPARPFLPFRADGSLYPHDQAHILDLLKSYLSAR
jgi:phage gpG-like protein